MADAISCSSHWPRGGPGTSQDRLIEQFGIPPRCSLAWRPRRTARVCLNAISPGRRGREARPRQQPSRVPTVAGWEPEITSSSPVWWEWSHPALAPLAVAGQHSPSNAMKSGYARAFMTLCVGSRMMASASRRCRARIRVWPDAASARIGHVCVGGVLWRASD